MSALTGIIKSYRLRVDVGPIASGGWRVSIHHGDNYLIIGDYETEEAAGVMAHRVWMALPTTTPKVEQSEDAW